MMRKYVVLIFAVLMQMCLGGTYAWTVFAGGFADQFGVDRDLAVSPFNYFYITFPLTVVLGGRLITKLGSRVSAMLGGALFGAGWLLASLGSENFLWTQIGAGVVGGIGVGLAYVVPISVGVAWWPDRRGLVTGLAVGGFAGGAALVSQFADMRIAAGASAFDVLQLCGVVYLALSLVAGYFMVMPDASSDRSKPVPVVVPGFLGLLKTPVFLALFASMTVGLTAGFFVNSNLTQISHAEGLKLALSGAAIFAIANAVGRIIWGAASDYTSMTRVIRINLICQAVTLALAPALVSSTTGMMTFAACTGFNYGGVLVLYAATVGRLWGNAAIGPIYGKLFASNIIASIIAKGITSYYNLDSVINVAAWVLAGVLCVVAFSTIKVLPARVPDLTVPAGDDETPA